MTDLKASLRTAREALPSYQQKWVAKAMEILRDDFQKIGYLFPDKIGIVVGYIERPPVAWLGTLRKSWNEDMTEDDANLTIFVNPTVDGIQALDILVHELVHACGVYDHGPDFKTICAAIGLDDTGPHAGAEEVLLKRLRDIHEILGNYPLITDFVGEL